MIPLHIRIVGLDPQDADDLPDDFCPLCEEHEDDCCCEEDDDFCEHGIPREEFCGECTDGPDYEPEFPDLSTTEEN